MSVLRILYLLFAVAGTAWPLAAAAGIAQGAVTLPALVGPLAGAETPDLWLVFAVFTLWVLAETWVRKNWIALAAIAGAAFIGISCGLPLYLYLRTRRIA